MKFIVIFLLLVVPGCTVMATLSLANDGVTVYVIDHGKHTGLALPITDIPAELIPELADFLYADYLEIGWGDRDYYQTKDPSLWLTLKAGVWPTTSVLHVDGVHGDLQDYFPGAEVARLTLSRDAFEQLVRYVHRSFDRQVKPQVWPQQRGYYPDSWFYPAHGRFYIFYTCNGWIAEALESSGLPMGWPYPITSDQLMVRIRQLIAVQ